MNEHEAGLGFIGWLVVWIVVMFAWNAIRKKDDNNQQKDEPQK